MSAAKELKFRAILREEEEGGYSARCLKLLGCVSECETRAEAVANFKLQMRRGVSK